MLPVILTTSEVRELLAGGRVSIRRELPSRSDRRRAELRYGRPGEASWVREDFAARRDGETIRIRYAADRRNAEPRVVARTDVAARFATKGYRTWPARFMPRWLSRLVVVVEGVVVEREGELRPVAVVRLRLDGDAVEVG